MKASVAKKRALEKTAAERPELDFLALSVGISDGWDARKKWDYDFICQMAEALDSILYLIDSVPKEQLPFVLASFDRSGVNSLLAEVEDLKVKKGG